jgi:hypothetical protein
MTQLRLERNHSEAIRLLQARQAQFQFASEIDKGTNQAILAFAQRLSGDPIAAIATAEQARNTLTPLYRDQPDNSFFAQQLALANAVLGEKETPLSKRNAPPRFCRVPGIHSPVLRVRRYSR